MQVHLARTGSVLVTAWTAKRATLKTWHHKKRLLGMPHAAREADRYQTTPPAATCNSILKCHSAAIKQMTWTHEHAHNTPGPEFALHDSIKLASQASMQGKTIGHGPAPAGARATDAAAQSRSRPALGTRPHELAMRLLWQGSYQVPAAGAPSSFATRWRRPPRARSARQKYILQWMGASLPRARLQAQRGGRALDRCRTRPTSPLACQSRTARRHHSTTSHSLYNRALLPIIMIIITSVTITSSTSVAAVLDLHP